MFYDWSLCEAHLHVAAFCGISIAEIDTAMMINRQYIVQPQEGPPLPTEKEGGQVGLGESEKTVIIIYFKIPKDHHHLLKERGQVSNGRGDGGEREDSYVKGWGGGGQFCGVLRCDIAEQ